MRTGGVCLLIVAALIALPAGALALKTDARCGLSAGAVVGPSFPTDPDLKDEFRYLYHIEAGAKYMLFGFMSVAGDLGYEFQQGAPKSLVHEGKHIDLDGRGRSYWRAMPFWGTLRLEPFRRYAFNPYIGAAGGGKYLILERSGRSREIATADSGDEWLLGVMGVAGFDYMFDDFIFIRAEARYSRTPAKDEPFLEDMDYGTWDALAGINVYF